MLELGRGELGARLYLHHARTRHLQLLLGQHRLDLRLRHTTKIWPHNLMPSRGGHNGATPTHSQGCGNIGGGAHNGAGNSSRRSGSH